MAEQELNVSGHGNASGSDYLSRVIKSVLASAPPPAVTNEDKETSGTTKETASGGAPMADLFSSLLSNPELIAKLPSLISTFKPIIETLNRRPADGSIPTGAEASGDMQVLTDKLSAQNEKKTETSADRRAALLCAMKPYLSPDRQNAIDYIIKLSRLGDMLKNL